MEVFSVQFFQGLNVAVVLLWPLAILMGLYFLARIVRALDRIANHLDRSGL